MLKHQPRLSGESSRALPGPLKNIAELTGEVLEAPKLAMASCYYVLQEH